jgi:hypothetical protein
MSIRIKDEIAELTSFYLEKIDVIRGLIGVAFDQEYFEKFDK